MFRKRRWFVVAVVGLGALAIPLPAPAQKTLQPQSRVWITRALLAEYATLKKPLPHGTEGLKLKSDGDIDEKALEVQLANFGPAVRPGEVAQVTKIDYRKDRIVFEMNGGGKKKRKWYQNIEVGMGGSGGMRTIRQDEVATGSVITLTFAEHVPDMTAEQVKEYLAPVLDFSRKSASLVITDTWPAEIQEAVKNHEITAGMTKDMVLASKGRPENKIREKTKRGVDQETWVYGTVPSKILLVVFEGDEVVEAHQYTPGVASTKVPRMDDPPEDPKAPPKPPK